MDWMFAIFVALGTWACNWLLVPLIGKRTFRDGFWIGFIAAILVLFLNLILVGAGVVL